MEDAPRLDSWLARQCGVSRSAIKQLILAGKVSLNAKAVKPSQAVLRGQTFLVNEEQKTSDIVPEELPLEIVYEDEVLIVVNKARGMVVHPAAGNHKGTLVNALLAYGSANLSDVQGYDRPGIVHRLDKDTSGLIIIAKNNQAHRHIANQLAKRSLVRIYQTIVWGQMEAKTVLIDAPVGRDPGNRQRMAVVADGKPAVTKIDLIEQACRGAHLSCQLTTGRTHQIRVHLSYIGHPVVGDMVYGKNKPIIYGDGQLLHAKSLKFIHPVSGETISLSSKLPPEFDFVMEYMRGEREN
jgi:23S rRNA pseudouridine1911/1915/1917 synthase